MFKKPRIQTLILLGVITLLTSATLSVYNREALDSQDDSLLDIKYSIANYGFAPYLPC